MAALFGDAGGDLRVFIGAVEDGGGRFAGATGIEADFFVGAGELIAVFASDS
ncbi:MAG: hypothetical protein ABIR62_06450 [Dokdonella sp.]